MSNEEVFDYKEEQQETKCSLIDTYFMAWAQTMRNTYSENMALVDLFPGRGRYGLGKPSAPVMALTAAASDDRLRHTLVSVFNDRKPEYITDLQKNVASIAGVEQLKHQPLYLNIDGNEELAEALKHCPLSPSLSFVDVWRYEHLTLDIIKILLAGVWGCDCFVFFDYARIKRGFDDPVVRKYMEALFGGPEKADALIARVSGLSPLDKELTIVNELGERLEEIGGKYVVPFCYSGLPSGHASYYMFFVSKHYEGYDTMKELISIEVGASSRYPRRFEYISSNHKELGLLYGFSPNKEPLKDQLLKDFAGQYLSVRSIFAKHNRRTLYTKKEYLKALLQLEIDGEIMCSPAERRQNTMADNVMVSFPAEPALDIVNTR